MIFIHHINLEVFQLLRQVQHVNVKQKIFSYNQVSLKLSE